MASSQSHIDDLFTDTPLPQAEIQMLNASCRQKSMASEQHFTHVFSLPVELWDRIFVYLSSDRRDIAASRSVCRQFREISSPHLITKVVFSRRADVLAKLYDVMEHKYFKTHVKELIWDASTFDKDMVNSFEVYKYTSIATGRKYHRSVTKCAEMSAWGQLWPRIAGETREPAYDEPDADDPEVDGNTLADYEYFIGFQQYGRLWLTQQAMDNREVPRTVLQKCLAEFPNLQHLVLTDHRGLARPEEKDYSEFCQRILGHACEPFLLSEDYQYQAQADFWLVLSILGEHGKSRLKSFSLGENPFHFSLPSCERSSSWYSGFRRGPTLAMRYLANLEPLKALEPLEAIKENMAAALAAFQGVQELRLPQRYELGADDDGVEQTILCSPLPQLLRSCSPTLVNLTFTAEYLVRTGVERDKNTGQWVIREGGKDALQTLLCHLSFEKLRCLDLRGWPVTTDLFEQFLVRHKHTLRQLRLVQNLISDERDLAERTGPLLRLEAVAMHNYPPEPRQKPLDLDALRPNKLDDYRYHTQQHHLEIETLWLDGRKNMMPQSKGSMHWRKHEEWA